MKTAVFACVLAVMAVAACAQTPCCGPRQISQLQFGLSTMNADAQAAGHWPAVNQIFAVDYDNKIAAQIMNNYTYEVILYTHDKTAKLYIPEFDICINSTAPIPSNLFTYNQLCTGPGSEFPTFNANLRLGTFTPMTESWQRDTGLNYINVDPRHCTIVAFANASPPMPTQLGIFYNITTQVDQDIFVMPSACTNNVDFRVAGHSPRVLRTVSDLVADVQRNVEHLSITPSTL